MAALIELAVHQAAVQFEAPEDDRDAPPWPTDFAQKRGVYTPAWKHKPTRCPEKTPTPMPAHMSHVVHNEYIRAGGVHSVIVQPTVNGPRMLEGIVPADGIPSMLRGVKPTNHSNEDHDLAMDLINFHTPEYRRARLETLLWRKPSQAANVMYLMDQINSNRKRTAQTNRDAYARRVQARIEANITTSLTPQGVAMDFP